MRIVGIDPSQRHTGICVLGEGLEIQASFDIKTEGLTILDSGVFLRSELAKLFARYPDALFSVEKMMPTARSGALLFYVQMLLMEELLKVSSTPRLVHPLPIQLKSYMQKEFKFVPKNKVDIVNAAKYHSGYVGRMSSHMADAYFLGRLAHSVVTGGFKYALSAKELPLSNWKIINGY